MKRLTVITLTLAISGTLMTQTAHAGPSGPCLERSWIPRTGMPTAEKTWRFVRLVDCAVRRWWPGAGHTLAALGAAWHESHYYTFAYNSTGCGGYGCLGAFQQHAYYWPGRRDFFLRHQWFRQWPIAWTNARGQAIVSVRMMAAQDGVCPAWC